MRNNQIMKVTLIVGGIILVSSTLFLLSAVNINKSQKPEVEVKKNIYPKKTTFSQKVQTSRDKRQTERKMNKLLNKTLKRQEVKTFEDAFLPIKENEVENIFKPKKNVNPVASFKFKKGSIRELNVGDTLVLPEIDGEIHEIQVLSKKKSSIGDSISLSGNIDGSIPGDKNTLVLMVEGKRTAFISIAFNGVEYESQIRDGIGYFYRSSDIKRSVQKEGKTDVIIPKIK